MLDLSFFHGPKAGYVLGLDEQFLADPSSVDASWQGYFKSFSPEEAAPRAEAGADASAAAASAAVDAGGGGRAGAAHRAGRGARHLQPSPPCGSRRRQRRPPQRAGNPAASEGLVLGDFANGAQVIIDQFIAAAYLKWRQRSGLVLLLPHGYEGQGPEHSSARLERFLQLAAEANIRVVNCTTSAQYFHLLRRQAALLSVDARPLVVMSPKSLLRHPLAASQLGELSGHSTFQPVIADASAGDRANEITRLLLCTGMVYVDLMGSELRTKANNVALARVEELFPFPEAQLREQIERFSALREVVWVQEAPKNMGAWSYMSSRLLSPVGDGLTLRYEGGPPRASPAGGFASQHVAEQTYIVQAAWAGATAPHDGTEGEKSLRVRFNTAAAGSCGGSARGRES
ncbi:MAG: 2-oxoglutarate dehydrogenase E1 subunit family protein [Gemmatimonadaceae bacterium]